jgi:hypothetical protein
MKTMFGRSSAARHSSDRRRGIEMLANSRQAHRRSVGFMFETLHVKGDTFCS